MPLGNQTGKAPISDERLGYRVSEFCRVIGIGKTKFYELRKSGKVRTVDIAGCQIVPASEATRLLTEGA